MYYVCAHVQDGRHLLHAAAVSGNEELVHMLIEDYGVEPGVSPVKPSFNVFACKITQLQDLHVCHNAMPPKVYFVPCVYYATHMGVMCISGFTQ